LFFDRMASYESLTFMDEYRRYWAKDEEDETDPDGPDAQKTARADKAGKARTGR
jgi:hypothetical protein